MALKTITAHEDENLKEILESEWGKSYFTCKTKPKTAALKDRVAGKITQPGPDGKRITYWVVAKPPRQQGDRPKESKTVTLPAEVVEATEARAEAEQTYFSTIVEAALRAYLGLKVEV